MEKYRYTVITFDFDDYEIIREIKNPLPDVEYIYVTNNKDVISNTWTIIYDDSYNELTNSFDKVVEFRKRVLDYCHTDICCRIDGSVQISGDAFEKTIDEFNKGKYDIAFIMHPWFNNLQQEYTGWVGIRNMPNEEAEKVKQFFNDNSYDSTVNTVYTLTMLIQRNNQVNKDINNKQYEVLCQLKEICNNEHFHRCDQAIFTYTMDKYFNQVNVMPLHYTILERPDECVIYRHKSKDIQVINKFATFQTFYKLFGSNLSMVFNGKNWVSLLTNGEIYKKATKILLKTTEKLYSSGYLDCIRTNKKNYEEWLSDEDVITIGSSNIEDYQHTDPNNRHHYTMDWYYKKLLPIIISELEIPYRESDFNEIQENGLYCKTPKEVQYLDVYCPIFNRSKERGYVEVFYNMGCLHQETSETVFMGDSVYQPEIFNTPQDTYHKIFKYCRCPVKIVNNTCQNNDAILVIGNDHTIPFVPIFTKYYHTVVVIDNRLLDFTYDFMFSYIDFKNILILSSYDKNKDELLKVVEFD